jgi:TusA-related sulfurtransferase
METLEFDIRGQLCPSTLLVALKEVNLRAASLKNGTLKLCFLTDNRDSTTTIPESVANMGYAVAVEKKDGYYSILIAGKKELR